MSTTYPTFDLDLKPHAGRIGAVIHNVKLSPDLDQAVLSSIKQALLHYKVIFFRGQEHLDDSSQEAIATLFGDVVSHPTVPSKGGTSHVLELDSEHGGRANSWHTDVTFDVAYPKISVLRGVKIPAAGGDTVWANAEAAYEDLPEDLRALADKLWALHTNDYDYATHRVTQVTPEDIQRFKTLFTSTVYETEHPVVRVHPETGKRSLLLGHFVKRLVNHTGGDSQHLISILQNHVIRLENTARWQWTQGDVAIWDNRATQHYAINDYGTQHRIVRRVTVAGEVPVSVDGQLSRSLSITANPQAANNPKVLEKAA
jgi:alpha-ketoglutarate-dependent taurine dioxygenase